MDGLSGLEEYGGEARDGKETVMPYLHMPDAHLMARSLTPAQSGGNDRDQAGMPVRPPERRP
jgi:hypothetical protein